MTAPPRLARTVDCPRSALDVELDELVGTKVRVALSGKRARPLIDLGLAGTEQRVLPVFRSLDELERAAELIDLRGEDGTLRSVPVEGVHALAHVRAARLAGLIVDPGAALACFVTPDAARRAIARAEGRPPSIRPEAKASEPTRARAGAADSAPRVVIVDDDALVLRAVARFLETRGAHVHQVASSLEAAAIVAMESPTVIVLDVMMPGLDGTRVFEMLRQASEHPPAVVFYSGIDPRAMAAIARGDPNVERVSKRSEPAELWAAVERAHARGTS